MIPIGPDCMQPIVITNDDNDKLYGQVGDDLLVGGTGADTIYTGSTSVTIVLRSKDRGSKKAEADTIADFINGADILVLDGGLQYSNLTIAQGSGIYANATTISVTSTVEYLAIVQNINVNDLIQVENIPII